MEEKYTRVLEDTMLSIDVGQNIIVIKTVSGMAMGVAAALDALKMAGKYWDVLQVMTLLCVLQRLQTWHWEQQRN